MIKYISLTIFSLLLSVNPALIAQKPVNDLSSKQKQCFTNRCRSLGINNPQFFYQHQINITKADDFKKNGVDLQQMSRRWNGFTPLEHTLLVPNIVKARVVGMEDAPPAYGQFKVVYTLAVEQTITGEKLPSRIEVYSRSHGGNGSFFSFNNEPVLQLGEEAVLYLSQFQITPIQQREAKPANPVFEEISLKSAPSQVQQTGPEQIFVASVKFVVKEGQLLDARNRPFAKEAEFKKMAEKIYKINQQKKFFSRSYC